MKHQQSLVIELGILFLGIAIIFACYVGFAPTWTKMSSEDIYFWGNLLLIYVIFMATSVFFSIKATSIEKNIFPAIATWMSDALFAIFSIALIFCVMKGIFIPKVAIALQFVFYFIFAIAIYVALFTGQHTKQVATRENIVIEEV